MSRLWILVILLLLSGCGSQSSPAPAAAASPTTPTTEPAVPVALTIITSPGSTATSAQVIAGGATLALHAEVTYSNDSVPGGSPQPVGADTWTSSAPGVATVTGFGVVQGVAAGQTQITATWETPENTWLTAPAFTITVEAAPVVAAAPTVVFIGDDTTLALFAQPGFAAAHPTWISAGVAGETTAQALAAFQAQCISQRPAVCHIQIGLADIEAWFATPGQNLGLLQQSVEADLAQMVQEGEAAGITVVLATEFPSFYHYTPGESGEGPPQVDVFAGGINQWAFAAQVSGGTTGAITLPPGSFLTANYWQVLTGGCGFQGYCDYLPGLTTDDLVPNAAGYNAMQETMKQAIMQAEQQAQERKAGGR